MLVSNNSLGNQHSIDKKFDMQWKGPYVVPQVHPNVVYKLRELDGTELRNLIAGKRIKFFRRRPHDQDIFADDLDYEVDSGDATEEQVEDLSGLFESVDYYDSS